MESTESTTPAVAPAAEVVREQKGRGRLRIVLGAFVALGGGVGGYRLWTAGDVSTDDAMVDGDVVPVSAMVGGPISTVLVADNAHVHAGDALTGTLYFNRAGANGEADAAMMNTVCFDAFTLGNHEGDNWWEFFTAWQQTGRKLNALNASTFVHGPLVIVGFLPDLDTPDVFESCIHVYGVRARSHHNTSATELPRSTHTL